MTERRIIVALDYPDAAAARQFVTKVRPEMCRLKVGKELFVAAGPDFVRELVGQGYDVFLDLKFHDIPNTMAGACRAAGRYGVDLLTVHAAAGQTALVAANAAAQQGAAETGNPPPNLIAITLLTSISSRSLALELKVPLELPDYALQMALLAQTSGLAGAVCSPQEAAQLRQSCGDDFLLVCPGVRPIWAESGDQQRTMTPAAALRAGASYLVVGRPITAAVDPKAAFERICAELEQES